MKCTFRFPSVVSPADASSCRRCAESWPVLGLSDRFFERALKQVSLASSFFFSSWLDAERKRRRHLGIDRRALYKRVGVCAHQVGTLRRNQISLGGSACAVTAAAPPRDVTVARGCMRGVQPLYRRLSGQRFFVLTQLGASLGL